METVLLALELLRRIPPRRKITADELKRQLEATGIRRDLRTIQRQLSALSAHFEIERDDRDKPYGYRWKEKARGLSLPGLGPQDSLILALAEQQLRKLLPPGLMKSMEAFFHQAQRNLDPASGAVLEGQWLKKVRVVSATQPLLPPAIKPGVFEAVSEALYRNHWLSIDYRNAAGGRTTSDVMPLGLALQGERLYLVCRFRGFEHERNVALHRIQEAKATTLPFDRPRDFDMARYDGEGRFLIGDGKRIRLTFHITRAAGFHLTESRLSQDQTVKEIEDGYEITATVVDSLLLDQWLRGFGDEVCQVKKRPLRGSSKLTENKKSSPNK